MILIQKSKTFLLGLLKFLPILTAFAASCQHIDTITVNKTQLVKVLTKAEQARALEAQRDLLLNEVDTLKARIVIKEMMIENLHAQLSDHKNIITSLQSIIKTDNDKVIILQNQIASLNKQIKKERRKKKWIAFSGIVLTGLFTYLYITK